MEEQLHELLVKALTQCQENGMQLPFVVCTVGTNGSVLVTRVNDGRKPDTLAEHFVDQAFTTPVNVMVVDRSGEAARIVIQGGGTSYQ